jgi:hypothetical protein
VINPTFLNRLRLVSREFGMLTTDPLRDSLDAQWQWMARR